jgi:hypothetical protein
MFTRRSVRRGLGLALVVLAGAVALWCLAPANTGSRIRKGMTFAQVQAAVGQTWPSSVFETGASCNAFWDCPDGSLTTLFTRNDQLLSFKFTPRRWSPLKRLRALLDW